MSVAARPLRVAVKHPERGVVQGVELPAGPEPDRVPVQRRAGVWHGAGRASDGIDGSVKDMMRNGAGDNLRIFGARNPIPWVMGKGWGILFS